MITMLAKLINISAGIFEWLVFLASVIIVLMFVDLEPLGRDCSAWE